MDKRDVDIECDCGVMKIHIPDAYQYFSDYAFECTGCGRVYLGHVPQTNTGPVR